MKYTYTIIFVIIGCFVYGQISYTYDSSGNRTDRETIILKSTTIPVDSIIMEDVLSSFEKIGDEFNPPQFEESVWKTKKAG